MSPFSCQKVRKMKILNPIANPLRLSACLIYEISQQSASELISSSSRGLSVLEQILDELELIQTPFTHTFYSRHAAKIVSLLLLSSERWEQRMAATWRYSETRSLSSRDKQYTIPEVCCPFLLSSIHTLRSEPAEDRGTIYVAPSEVDPLAIMQYRWEENCWQTGT